MSPKSGVNQRSSDRKILDKECGSRVLRIHEVSQKCFQASLVRRFGFTLRVRIWGLFRGELGMLALVSIFLFTLAVSAVAVWLYRRISGWHGFTHTLVARPRSASRTRIGLQQGFISMISDHRVQAKSVRLRTPRGGLKTPWGW